MRITHYCSFAGLLALRTGEDTYEIEAVFSGIRPSGKFLVRKNGAPLSQAYACEPAKQSCTCEGRVYGWECKHLSMLGALLSRHYFNPGHENEPADMVG